MNKFGYRVFLERVPLLCLQVPLNRMDPKDPLMLQWVEAMAYMKVGEGLL